MKLFLDFFYPTDRPNLSSGGRWETKHFVGMALDFLKKENKTDRRTIFFEISMKTKVFNLHVKELYYFEYEIIFLIFFFSDRPLSIFKIFLVFVRNLRKATFNY